jgi:predicted regulator of Ras-like GTPase activity (Roadblock/LC7/MglB family)
MFGVLKKLFSRSSYQPPDPVSVVGGPPRTPAPASSPKPSTPAVSAASLGGKTIALPLKEILSQLPEDLAGLVLQRSSGTLTISRAVAVDQLRTGAVRIPFAQLRQSAPAGTFADDGSHDESMVDLPLSLILAAVGVGGLSKRSDQKRTDVPDEVVGVFGAKERAAAVSPAPGSARAPAAAPTAAKAPAAAPSAPPPSAANPIARAPAVAPLPPPVASKPVAPMAPPSVAHKQTTSITQNPASAPLPFAAQKPALPMPFATARPSPPPPVPAAPIASADAVVVKIEAVSGAWPDAVRQEIQQFNLGSAAISIPLTRLEPGMKSGRLVFTWADLCGWLSEPLPASANGQSELELPLQIIAPLFMASRRATAPRKIVTVGEDLPDLFGGAVQPAAPPAEPVAAPEEAPAVAELPPVPVVAPAVPEESVAALPEGDLTPQEVVEWIMSLPGVAGAVLASNDGLLVAGQLPAPLETETMAAFLPQILMRINICTEEIRLGTMRSVTILVGQTSCAIFKAGALCLAVIGHPGKTLPAEALERMSGELARQNQ